ncbi:MAG: CvpA family protein [Ruminococcus sp.]
MIFDIVLIAVIIVFAVVGYKKGIAKSVLSIVSFVLSAVLALLFARMLSVWIFDAFVKKAITQNVADAISASGAGDAAAAVNAVIMAIPQFASNMFNYISDSPDGFSTVCEDALTLDGESAASTIVGAVEPAVVGVISLILGIVLFVVLSFLLSKLAGYVAKLFRLPVIRVVDSIGGLILGVAEGFFAVFLCAMVLNLLMPLISANFSADIERYIMSSYIFSHIYSGDIFTKIRFFLCNIGSAEALEIIKSANN